MSAQYVAGFLFRNNGQEVALIRKNKPAWQKGKLNGIGGKIERDETQYSAMVREFKEEMGALVTNWERFCVLSVIEGNATIHFFSCAGGEYVDLNSTTDEEVVWRPTALLGEPGQCPVIENLRWLVPLARESLTNPKTVFVDSARP
jgi:8-oxo-dGTP diphosphatase